MLLEINGKAGRVCEHAKTGKIHCPLIVRPTSEDAITSQLFTVLQCISPKVWVTDLLATGLGVETDPQQEFKNFRVSLWERQNRIPKRLVPWSEGQTEVDAVLRWENPATTVFIEMKYCSPLSKSTTGTKGRTDFPNDQLIRNIRVGLWKNHWYSEERLFDIEPRIFYMLLVAPNKGNALVRKYRSNQLVRNSIPNSHLIRPLPKNPWVGELSFRDIPRILNSNREKMNRTERLLTDMLDDYIYIKLGQARK